MSISRRLSYSVVPWIRWPIAVLFSLVANVSLLAVIVKQVEPEPAAEPMHTMSVIEEPPPEPAPIQAARASGGATSAWKSVLPSNADAPVGPPSFELPFDPYAPQHVDPTAVPMPGAFTPEVGEFAVVSMENLGNSVMNRAASLVDDGVFKRFYPRAAQRRGITGETVLELEISEAGRVTKATVISSTPRGVFDSAAKKGAPYARFRPAMKDGKPVAVQQCLRLEWTPLGR